jgi:hypothetical protein
MMKTTALLVMTLAAPALVACHKNETVKRVEALADEACACRDPGCADAVDRRFLALVKEGPRKGSRSDREAIEKAYGRMRACAAKARTATAGPGGAR